MKLKIIAHSTIPGPSYIYDFKVIVEIDRETLNKLTRHQHASEPPPVGTEVDISPTLARVEDLEERERDSRNLVALLRKLTAIEKPE